MAATSGFRASGLRSRSFWAILAVAGVSVMAAVGLAAPAAASRAALQTASPSARVYGFGVNSFGELGNGTTTASLSPVATLGPPGTVRQLAAGFGASAALLSDGTVWTWGNNDDGQLGYPTSTGYVPAPRQVPGLSGITQVAMIWGANGYALGSDGTVWAWGDNSYGQLGNGTTTPATIPARVPGLDRVTQLAVGDDHVLARRSDGTVAAWGDNYYGELGDGTTLNRLTPVQVQGLTGITQIATGRASYAVRSDGTLFSWGDNSNGLLGTGSTGGYTTTPAPVSLPGVAELATNNVFTLAVVGSAERVFAWGGNSCGQLGDGTTVARSAPELIGLVGVSQVAVSSAFGNESSAAVRYDGTLWTWGCNFSGQLDNGTPIDSDATTPTAVANLTGVSQLVFGDELRPGGLFDSGAYALVIGSPVAVAVPAVLGYTTAQAGQALQAAGLTLGTVSTLIDSTCNNIGTVMKQSPSPGTMVPPGSAVSITIGKAPPPPRQCA